MSSTRYEIRYGDLTDNSLTGRRNVVSRRMAVVADSAADAIRSMIGQPGWRSEQWADLPISDDPKTRGGALVTWGSGNRQEFVSAHPHEFDAEAIREEHAEAAAIEMERTW